MCTIKKILTISITLLILTSCKNPEKEKTESIEKPHYHEVNGDDYQLIKPQEGLDEILVLFGGYPEKAEDIKREFKIVEAAVNSGVAVVFMNYNQKLWFEENEKQKLADQLQIIFDENELPKSNIFYGGFSSGGNVALLLSDYLTEQSSEMAPMGVFVVDSPIDLAALYRSSEKTLERNNSELPIQESAWLVRTLGKRFGNPDEGISNYENYSIYTSETGNVDNIKNLKDVKIRFYSEPDTIWWKENRGVDYDQMNAFYIEKLAKLLKTKDFKRVEYITTKNKGYRANGDRHPHSWAIVDKNDLMHWITN